MNRERSKSGWVDFRIAAGCMRVVKRSSVEEYLPEGTNFLRDRSAILPRAMMCFGLSILTRR